MSSYTTSETLCPIACLCKLPLIYFLTWSWSSSQLRKCENVHCWYHRLHLQVIYVEQSLWIPEFVRWPCPNWSWQSAPHPPSPPPILSEMHLLLPLSVETESPSVPLKDTLSPFSHYLKWSFVTWFIGTDAFRSLENIFQNAKKWICIGLMCNPPKWKTIIEDATRPKTLKNWCAVALPLLIISAMRAWIFVNLSGTLETIPVVKWKSTPMNLMSCIFHCESEKILVIRMNWHMQICIC